MGEFTDYQRRVIERYYDRREQILLTRLGEIASELYLAESESRRTQLWRRAEKAMQGLKVPATVVTHIITERRPELLASHLRRLLDEAARLRR
ncbi:MAG: hypothetical protein HY763_00750 [Planctomycetes bacterium]|nr:hypothetical protein [Planctomycetota bacterium]